MRVPAQVERRIVRLERIMIVVIAELFLLVCIVVAGGGQ